MSSRASPIPSDAFERPSSPHPSTSPPPPTSRPRTVPSVSPFQPIILPSSHSRPIVRRHISSAGSNEAVQPRLFGEIGKEDDDSWERASIMSSSSWGGPRGEVGDSDEAEPEKRFLPRLRNLRSARPNVRKPETQEKEVGEEIEEVKPEAIEIADVERSENDEKEDKKEVEKVKNLAEVAKVEGEAATTENSASV